MSIDLTVSLDELAVIRQAIEVQFDIANDTVLEDSGLYTHTSDPVLTNSTLSDEKRKAYRIAKTNKRIDELVLLTRLQCYINTIQEQQG